MNKPVIGYIWFLTLMGALFFGHEIGFVKGQRFEKDRQGYKFERVHPAFAEAQ